MQFKLLLYNNALRYNIRSLTIYWLLTFPRLTAINGVPFFQKVHLS